MRIFKLVAALFLMGTLAHAQTPDPLAVHSTSEIWVFQQSIFAPPATRRDITGGRFQAIAGFGRWGVGVRAETSGLPGEYVQNKPETFRTGAAYLGIHRNLIARNGITIGAAALGGAAISLELQNGVSPRLPKAMTVGLGARADGPGWWAYVVVGQYQALKGISMMAAVHAKLTDRTAWVGDFAIGANSTYIASFGIAVRAF